MVMRSGRTPAYWVLLLVSGTPSYRPSRPGGPSLCSTSTTTLRIRLPSSPGSPSSASATISSNLAGSMSITSPLLRQVTLATNAGSNPQIVRPLAGPQRLAQDHPVAGTVGRRLVGRGPVGDRDRGGAARLDRRDIERREAERRLRVTVCRPRCRLGLDHGPALDERVAGLDA